MLLLAVFSLLPAVPALAVEDPTDYPISGVEFGLPSNLGLDNFGLQNVDGYDFSLTRRTSRLHGWRLGMSVYFDRDSDEQSGGYVYPDYRTLDNRELKSIVSNVSIRVQRLLVSEPRHGVSFVLGFGPSFGYDYYSSEDRTTREYVPFDPENDTYPDPTDDVTDRDRNTIWVGAVWDAGIEWRVTRQLTVGARYQWSLTYRMQDESVRYLADGEFERESIYKSTDYTLSSGSVDLVATFWY